MDELLRTEYRCDACGRFLFRGLILKDEVEMKCTRCKKVHYFPGLGVAGRAKLFAILTDTDGTIVNASTSVKTALGKHISQLTGTPISQLFTSDKEAASDAALADLAAKHKYVRLSTSIATKESDCHAVMVSYVHVLNNGRDFVLRAVSSAANATADDLTALDFSPADLCPFIAEADGTGIIQYVSGNVEELFGYRPEEVVGRHVSDFHAPDEVDLRAKYQEFFAKRALTYRQKKHALMTKGGTQLSFEIHATPLYDQTGEFVGYKNMLWPES